MASALSLESIPLLASLDQEARSLIASDMRERSVPKGSFIIYAEDPGPSLMFLVEGTAKITLVSEDGKEIILAQMGPGDFFGEIALLAGGDRCANVVASTNCKLLVLPEEQFHQQCSKNPDFTLALMRELALRLRASSAKIGDLALLDVYRRVARTLATLAVSDSDSNDGTMRVEQRPTHQELASMVGTSREMVTRALKGLEEDGHIEIEGKTILIHSLPD
ncbi:MAG: Crp/Fnr family transcriptional regulator [Bdellovibrionales bacterium]|nr:Crp/Fnr family transcriptional regulator [Bdellovibrionales bacterium]